MQDITKSEEPHVTTQRAENPKSAGEFLKESTRGGLEGLKEGVTDAFLTRFLLEFHYENVSLTQ